MDNNSSNRSNDKRASSIPASASTTSSNANVTSSSLSFSTNKTRQYAHLNSQLAQLNAHLADTENLVRMTAVQAQDIRFLGGYMGALFMGSAKVLGEESLGASASAEGREASEAEGSQNW